MNIRQELQGALGELERLAGGFIQYPYPNGIQLPCTYDDERQGMEYDRGGKLETVQFSIRVRNNAYQAQTGDSALSPTGDSSSSEDSGDSNVIPLQIGKKLLFEQKVYRILGVVRNKVAGVDTADLGSPEQ